jgi:hypothetical protein
MFREEEKPIYFHHLNDAALYPAKLLRSKSKASDFVGLRF